MTAGARPARMGRTIVDAGVWPNVRGKRCLYVGAVGDESNAALVDALHTRGAAEVVTRLLTRDDIASLASSDAGVFDVVVATRVLHASTAPAALVAALRAITRGVLLSTEPIDLWLSVLARGRPLGRLGGAGDSLVSGFNGAGHRLLLDEGGFAIERVSKPFVVPGSAADGGGRAAALATRLLTGGWEQGVVHRTLLARPRVPAVAPATT